jgi:UTP--glucose-1-phosphate uridylyltransferase
LEHAVKKTEQVGHLTAFRDKMRAAGLPPTVADTFQYYYGKVVTGETGLLSDREISPVEPEDLEEAGSLQPHAEAGRRALDRTVMIKLNGGLGTSMGLSGAKSLLEVKNGKSFLEIILRQVESVGVTLALMNSFSTDDETRAALAKIGPGRLPEMFLQHKYPKILQHDLSPAIWEKARGKEWNPPGHGDIYTALYTSGMLERLLGDGKRYAFISNSDNLGAILDPALLGFFSEKEVPFMMEVAERTPSDTKGGHLAKYPNGRLVLREVAQCPREEIAAFTDIHYYRYFNTNNIWINLEFLENLIRREGSVPLPMILNPKPLDPRDESSPPVYQVETAMGAAISLFEGATAVRVPKHRLVPVKKCNDLLVIRSDYICIAEDGRLYANPLRKTDEIKIDLDPSFFGKIDQFEQRFARGVPSLVECESLTVRGDVFFESPVTVRGKSTITNPRQARAIVPSGSVIEGDLAI